MPKIATYQFLTFFIYIYDVFNEPPHLHITKQKGNYNRPCKIWLETLEIAEVGDFTEKELNLIEKLVKKNKEILIKAFTDTRNGERNKAIKLKL